MTQHDSHTRARGRPREKRAPTKNNKIQTIDRAMQIIQCLTQELKATLKIIAAGTGLPSSTVHRILESLRVHNMVSFDSATQTWSMGVEAFRIGQAYAQRMDFLECARAELRELTLETGETSNIAVTESWMLIHIWQVETQAPIRAFIPPGTRTELYASGIGKALLSWHASNLIKTRLQQTPWVGYTPNTIKNINALLAQLKIIRQRGWALDDEERYLGMRCVAAPVFDPFGEAVAGVSISGPVSRFADATIPQLAARVLGAAQAITRQSGGHWPPELEPPAAAAP